MTGSSCAGSCAERYGDRTNDGIYWLNDLPAHKWAAAYLRERPPSGFPAHAHRKLQLDRV